MAISDVSKAHSGWDSFFEHNPASRHRRRIIKNLIGPLPFYNLLDVGCGGGQLLHYLCENIIGLSAFQLSGLDINRPEKPELLRRLGADFYEMDIEEKGSFPRPYDLVIASELLEHTKNDYLSCFNIAQLSKKYILITVPHGTIYPTDKAMGHVRHYTEVELRARFEILGFRTIKCFRWGWPFHSLYRWLLNRFPSKMIVGFGKDDYSYLQVMVCNLLYCLFFLNIRGKGDQLFYLGERK